MKVLLKEGEIQNGLKILSIENIKKEGQALKRKYIAQCILCNESQSLYIHQIPNRSCIYCKGDFGKKFNNLTFIELVMDTKKGQRVGKFKCDCGNIRITKVTIVRKGLCKSCDVCCKKIMREVGSENIRKNNIVSRQLRERIKELELELEKYKNS